MDRPCTKVSQTYLTERLTDYQNSVAKAQLENGKTEAEALVIYASKFKTYFFQGTFNKPPQFPSPPDEKVRCIECGWIIADHTDLSSPADSIEYFNPADTSASGSALKKSRTERASNLVELTNEDAFHQLVLILRGVTGTPTTITGLPKGATEPSFTHGIFVRQSYKDLLESLKKWMIGGYPRAIISGTPGIGKSTFRYYLLWAWLQGQLSEFKSIDFDHDGKSYFIRRNADGFLAIFCMRQQREWSFDKFESTLGLYELSEIDTGRESAGAMKFALWVSSPGASQKNGKALLTKTNTTRGVLPVWSEKELQDASGGVLPSTAKKYGGVPRLVWASEADADVQIQNAVDAIGQKFQGMDISDEKRVAHRVLIVAMQSTIPNWEVVGFISQHVANLVYEAHLSNIFAEGRNLAGNEMVQLGGWNVFRASVSSSPSSIRVPHNRWELLRHHKKAKWLRQSSLC